MRQVPAHRGNMPAKVAEAASLGGKLTDGNWFPVYECALQELLEHATQKDLEVTCFAPRTAEQEAKMPNACVVAMDVDIGASFGAPRTRSAVYFAPVTSHQLEAWRKENKELHERRAKEERLQEEIRKAEREAKREAAEQRKQGRRDA